MGKAERTVALDANAFTYIIQGLSASGDGPQGNLAAEKIALVRAFLYRPEGFCFVLPPTVIRQCERISDPLWRETHERWHVHFGVLHPPPDPDLVESKAAGYGPSEKDYEDCKIRAECELTPWVSDLITRDTRLLEKQHLAPGRVRLWAPVAFWEYLDIPRAYPPSVLPGSDHPLSRTNWWVWN